MSASSRFVSGGTIAGDGDATSAATPTAALASPAPAPAPASAPTNTHPHPHGHGHRHTTANPSAPVLDAVSSTPSAPTAAAASSTRALNAEWEAAQAALEAERRKREEARRQAVEGSDGDGNQQQQSLFDILQANKAAKQAAFEEANRLRNQFRALDDDEIDFLDEVRQREREDEARARRELAAGLDGFRRAQRGAGGEKEGEGAIAAGDAEAGVEKDLAGQGEEWAASGRKRKRNKDRDRGLGGLVKGVKRRASESTREVNTGDEATGSNNGTGTATKEVPQSEEPRADPASPKNEVKADAKGEQPSPPPPKPVAGMGLVDYGSDDDD